MRRIAALFVIPLLALVAAAVPSASAATSKAAYSWHVADQLLQNEVGSPPWALARADNGDVIAVQGFGEMNVAAKTASGTARLRHYNAAGDLLATGTFTATGLASFQFYGCGGAGLPDILCGGLAKLEGTVTPDANPSAHLPALLWVDCLLGTPPPSGVEGVRLNIKDLINFTKSLSEEEGSGFTVFLAE